MAQEEEKKEQNKQEQPQADAKMSEKDTQNGKNNKAAEESKDSKNTADHKDGDHKDQSEQGSKAEVKDPLAEANKQIADLKDKYLRSVAEFDNYKKRTLKEKAELILNGGERTVTALLPVLDDMERALANKSDDPKAIREGMEMIFNKFIKALETLGVKKIETKDQDFNTDYHEAVAMVPGQGDDKKGKVIDCVQAGYTMNDKVIRHAKVAVAQ
jgi:molecular chaperone GrpE